MLVEAATYMNRRAGFIVIRRVPRSARFRVYLSHNITGVNVKTLVAVNTWSSRLCVRSCIGWSGWEVNFPIGYGYCWPGTPRVSC